MNQKGQIRIKGVSDFQSTLTPLIHSLTPKMIPGTNIPDQGVEEGYRPPYAPNGNVLPWDPNNPHVHDDENAVPLLPYPVPNRDIDPRGVINPDDSPSSSHKYYDTFYTGSALNRNRIGINHIPSNNQCTSVSSD